MIKLFYWFGLIINHSQNFTPWTFFLLTVRAVIVRWFNYGTDPILIQEQNAEKNRYAEDTCLFMRLTRETKMIGTVNITRDAYPWYQQQHCSDPKGYKHPYICEYEGEM